MNPAIKRLFQQIPVIEVLVCMLFATALPAPAANLIWTGAVNTNWDFSTKNWLSNGVAVSLNQVGANPNLTFNDIGVGTVNMVLVASPGSLTFANNLTNYTFTSNSLTFVTGNTGITLNGKGSVTLNSPNSFTGDTVINQGTLILGSYGGLGQVLLYNGVPPGNLVFGGLGNAILEPNEALPNVSQTTTFKNLVLNSGANAQISSNGNRGANDLGAVVFNGTITRNISSSLCINYSIKAGTANNGVYFTNTLPWTNGLLGGGYLHTGSDWLAAQTNFNNGNNPASGLYNYAGYSNNPAIGVWVSTNNISVSNNTASVTASATVNTLKLSGPASVTISPSQTLAIQTGGLLVSSAGTGPSAVNGGTLVGAHGADLIVLQNYKSNPLTIGSVIADNGPATALTLGGLGGTLIFTNNETYTGATYVNNGTLALAGGGSIFNSPLIIVSASATLDASQLTGSALSLVSGQTLGGNGSVNGSVTVAPGAVVAAGAGDIGVLTFSNDLSLAGTVVMKLRKDIGYPCQSDLMAVGGALTCGGTLDVTNIGSGTFTNGDSFKLFSAGSYSGAFTNIVPATPGAGLAWNVSSLVVNGTLSVTYAPPVFAGAALSETNFTFLVTNSVAGATNYILTSTNMALPPAHWTRLATNVFDASGNLAFTNGVNQSQPAQFYLLQLP